MSLSRAFTTRRANKGSTDLGSEGGIKMPFRSNTVHKAASHQAMRHKISAPMELVHTTNMLSYNAPDVPRNGLPSGLPGPAPVPVRTNSAAGKVPSRSNTVSTRSTTNTDAGDWSSASDHAGSDTAASSPPTSPDSERADTVEPNHLSCYFMAPGTKLATGVATPPMPSDAPAIPKRSPSHTKKQSIDAIARKRSISHMSKASEHSNHSQHSSPVFSRPSSTSTRASSASHASSHHQTLLKQQQQVPPPPVPQPLAASRPAAPSVDTLGPFGQELAQVSELAEEFAASSRPNGLGLEVIYEDEQYMKSRGLVQRSVDDYLDDIHNLMATFWPSDNRNHPTTSAPMWI